MTIFAPQKPPKNHHRSLKESLRTLDYILKFPAKLLVKVCFGDFRIFLRLYSRLIIFASQKPQKNHHRSLKDIWHQPKLLLLFKMNVKVFDKIVSLAIFVIFAIIFKVIFSFDNVFTSKTSNNCHRSLKWI